MHHTDREETRLEPAPTTQQLKVRLKSWICNSPARNDTNNKTQLRKCLAMLHLQQLQLCPTASVLLSTRAAINTLG